MITADYKIPANGLGTDFSQYERPLSFASVYTNRFRNINGGAEKRAGMQRYGNKVAGDPNLTRLHEWVGNTGTEILLASDDFGNIYKYSVAASAWSLARSGGSSSRYISGQAEEKLIFVNGTDRNLYTKDGGATFNELKAIITGGQTAGGSGTTTLIDGDISNWIGNTLVSNNDIVHNVTLNAYGIVSTVASASLTHTAIGNAATGAGNASTNQATGQTYELIDYVDLNVIPQSNNIPDNVATAGSGTSTTVIAVSGVDFSTTEIRNGDFIYNTTRAAISMVGSVSANVNLQHTVASQVAGDALAFFKSAMPIASWVHINYGRAYFIDSRNQTRVIISAPDDPEDVTTFQKTLDSTSFSFGTQQPQGDPLLTLGTFQSYFVAGGKKNVYIYNGNTPIQDTSSTTLNFSPVAAYPNGLASRFSMGLNGSDLLFIAKDGLQAISIGNISNTTIHNNISAPLKNAMAGFIESSNTDNIQFSFYPKRAWLINKIGDRCYILNNSPIYDNDGNLAVRPSWHLFTGKWAQQNHYFIRRDGSLMACGSNGLIYSMDNAAATDDGDIISTALTMPWVTLEEPKKSTRIKSGSYIRPVFESNPQIVYTINAVAGWDGFSGDTVAATADGGGGQIGVNVIGTDPIGNGSIAQSNKFSLQWRGEQVEIEFTTNTSASPDIITGFTLYGNVGGRR